MGNVLTGLLASLTKKVILVLAIVVTWLLRTFLPESIVFGLVSVVLGLGGYSDRLRLLKWYWTGDDPEATV